MAASAGLAWSLANGITEAQYYENLRESLTKAVSGGVSDATIAKEMEKYGISFGRTRLGLHSGEALVGNFGGAKRFNYTAYGQTVVIAARLEASNKEYDTVVLLSDATLERAKNPGVLEYIGSLKLKGVPDPIRAYTPR